MDLPINAIYEAAMSLLPPAMNSQEAKALVFAIGFQESGFEHRRQMDNGPARGFWQFEQGGGVRGVLTHPMTKGFATTIVKRLGYDDYPATVWSAMEHNDLLASAFARLNLYWLPQRLPGPTQAQEGWLQYADAWRPGKPHPEKWPENFAKAWQMI
ncbi:MAG: hypothetical protein IT531_03115 [Burkholderiales bacterium]|nr:hypothetical protein [Burkholderiales bacterium]